MQRSSNSPFRERCQMQALLEIQWVCRPSVSFPYGERIYTYSISERILETRHQRTELRK